MKDPKANFESFVLHLPLNMLLLVVLFRNYITRSILLKGKYKAKDPKANFESFVLHLALNMLLLVALFRNYIARSILLKGKYKAKVPKANFESFVLHLPLNMLLLVALFRNCISDLLFNITSWKLLSWSPFCRKLTLLFSDILISCDFQKQSVK